MNWLHTALRYEWSSDLGNGPEALTEIVAVAFIGSFFVPRVRRWWGRHIDELKAHIGAENKALHEKLDHTHALLQHVITHSPDIPDYPKEDK